MKKKNIIISSIIALLVIIGIGVGLSLANDDYTCYNYTSTVSACSSSKTNCTSWVNGVRRCDGTNITTYNRGTDFMCDEWQAEDRSSYAVNGTCSVEYIDTVTPTVTNGGIE